MAVIFINRFNTETHKKGLIFMGVIHQNRDLTKKSRSGFNDPTANKAISKITKEDLARMDEEDRFYNLLDTLHYIIDLAGFDVEGRIVLKDRTNGKVWR